jgi:flagellar protein FlaG
MIESITISEKSVAKPDTGRSSEVKEAPRGEKQAEKESIKLDSSQMSELVADIKNEMIRNVGLQFVVHEDTGRVVVTVIDESTGKVIREIPPSEVLKLAANLDKTIGIIFDQKG